MLTATHGARRVRAQPRNHALYDWRIKKAKANGANKAKSGPACRQRAYHGPGVGPDLSGVVPTRPGNQSTSSTSASPRELFQGTSLAISTLDRRDTSPPRSDWRTLSSG
jgi:hypothetical protein